MNDRIRLSALLALLTIAAFGQDSASTSPQHPGGDGWFVSFGAGPMAGTAVTGAPYSAEEVTERVQTLADGTHVTQPSTTVKIYRDSEGRTRTERARFTRAAEGQADRTESPAMVEITDPVAHVMYTLAASEKVAHKRSIQAPESRPANRAGSFGSAAVAHDTPPPSASHETPQRERPQTTHEKLGTKPWRA